MVSGRPSADEAFFRNEESMNRRQFSRFSALALSSLAFSRRLAAVNSGAQGAPAATPDAEPPRPKLSGAYREYCFDFNWVDKLEGHVQPLSNYAHLSAAGEVEDLIKIDSDSLMVFCMSLSGYMFYNSKVGVRHPSLNFDYLKEIITLGHQKGIAMELYVPTMWADYLIQQHGDWGMRNPDGSLYTAAFGGYHPDLNSPAADWYVDVIRELIPAYGGDAFFADGITFIKYGQSEFTLKQFQQDLGRPYPTSLAGDPDWRATLRWEIKQIDGYWQKLRNAIKEQDPRVEVTFNGPGPEIAMPGRDSGINFVPEPPHLNPQTDYAFTEAGSGGEHADWTKGIAYPKPFRVTFNNAFSVLDPFDPDEVRARIGRTLAIGGMPYRYDRTSVNGEPDRVFIDRWGEIFKEVKEKTAYVKGAEPLKYVGIVSSEPTMFYRGRSDRSCHADDLLGSLRMLDALHIQHAVIADWNLQPDFLKPYALVILPNAGCMSDTQVAAVREYVRGGGRLLATAESSLFDENGNARPDFALADVFGVNIDETPSNQIQTEDNKKPVYITPSSSSHPILRPLPHTALIIPGDSVMVRATTGQATAYAIDDAGTPANSPDSATTRAAVQVNQFGKGQCVYICGSIFARSAWGADGAGVRWAGQLVEEIVQNLAPRAPWRLKASEKIWAGLNAQPSQLRHVLHLVNWQTDLPAADLRVSIAEGLGVGGNASMAWPNHLPLRVETRGNMLEVVIPKVGPHVMVVFE